MKNKASKKLISIVLTIVFLLDVVYSTWWYVVYKAREANAIATEAYNEPHAGDRLMPSFMRAELFLGVYLFDAFFVVFVLVFWFRNKTIGCMPILIFMFFYLLKFLAFIIFIANSFLASGNLNY